MEVKKKVNNLIPMLIQNGVVARHRSLFVIVGDYARDQVANLHYMLAQSWGNRQRPSVLWCYKSELGFSSNKQKRAEKLKKQIRQGTKNGNTPNAGSMQEDPFDMFLSSTNITYTYYKETENILGRTFGMLVLQDFQSLTPNIIARTMETVEGGGIVCLLLKNVQSLKQLITMSMDVHDVYKNSAFQNGLSGRFNYRFLLSLTTNRACCVVDDELNILPISSHIYDLQKINADGTLADRFNANGIKITSAGGSANNNVLDPDGKLAKQQAELKMLKQSLSDTEHIGPLVNMTVTLDQAKAYLKCTNVLANNNPNATVTLFAGRGRGKSTTLGFALAQAIVSQYSNIFITAPSPTNVMTVFEFAIKGLEALGYKKNIDFDVIEGNLKDLQNATTNALDTSAAIMDTERQSQRVIIGLVMRSSKPSGAMNDFNLSAVNKNSDDVSSGQSQHHRQTITYIAPRDNHLLTNCDLLFIDEAAAIPLPYILRLMKGANATTTQSGVQNNNNSSLLTGNNNNNNYMVFLSSTINGYEGTGRALSLQLIKTLREQTSAMHYTALSAKNKNLQKSATRNQYMDCYIQNRILEEITMTEPIRYGPNDVVEKWMNKLLCLDCQEYIPKLISPPSASNKQQVSTGLPHPSDCTLYYVSRDTLFSCHDMSEHLLQQIMALYVSSYYKNSPNDLQLLADAPQHHLFALLGPQQKGKKIPDILAIAQVCLEGNMPRNNTYNTSQQHTNQDGTISTVVSGEVQSYDNNSNHDLIPWTVSQQYLTNDFSQLTGGRVYRIAVHPDILHLGYGSRLMQLIIDYYDGKIYNLDDDEEEEEEEQYTSTNFSVLAGNIQFNTQQQEDETIADNNKNNNKNNKNKKQSTTTTQQDKSTLLTEEITLTSRQALPPLFISLQQRKPEVLHWLGVSYGLSQNLHRFFKKFNFYTLNIKLTPNIITNEYTTIMLRAQTENRMAKIVAQQRGITLSSLWLQNLFHDFRSKLLNTLGFAYNDINASFLIEIISKTSTIYHQSQHDVLKLTINEDKEMNKLLLQQQKKKNNKDDNSNDMEIYNSKRVELLKKNNNNNNKEEKENKKMNDDDESDNNQQDNNNDQEDEDIYGFNKLTGNEILDTNEFANSTVTRHILYNIFTPFDLKRLDSYTNGMIDYTYILHTLPHLSRLYFLQQLTADLTTHQQSLLLGVGLQKKQLPILQQEMNIGYTQILALFNKAIRRLTAALRFVEEREIAQEIAAKRQASGILDKVAQINIGKDNNDTIQIGALHEEMEDAVANLKQQKWNNLDEVDNEKKTQQEQQDFDNISEEEDITPPTTKKQKIITTPTTESSTATKKSSAQTKVKLARKTPSSTYSTPNDDIDPSLINAEKSAGVKRKAPTTTTTTTGSNTTKKSSGGGRKLA